MSAFIALLVVSLPHICQGTHWTPQESGTRKRLNDVNFPTSTTGWAVGNAGVMVHTVDAGQTWNQVSLAVVRPSDLRMTTQ
ncbi:hypothetical protein CYMTET_44262 [Cymbomonas tetramitiformis]|uniref:Photosynthesis system II assembly factor Ycf48/Hcf136-like domain-containing protein n=1 Tax=Cymbomonas tetramitiformis TaxID=36881 RepID=A0AAE0C1S8_9CHLO|nr:hypothetical protein CYMTET_44262 [Cymbomonas tetramitiformis]